MRAPAKKPLRKRTRELRTIAIDVGFWPGELTVHDVCKLVTAHLATINADILRGDAYPVCKDR